MLCLKAPRWIAASAQRVKAAASRSVRSSCISTLFGGKASSHGPVQGNKSLIRMASSMRVMARKEGPWYGQAVNLAMIRLNGTSSHRPLRTFGVDASLTWSQREQGSHRCRGFEFHRLKRGCRSERR